MDCSDCGWPVQAHEPVYRSTTPGGDPTTQFCNYGCLAAHIEAEELVTDTACKWSAGE
jgi:hypothetical protein